MARACRRLHVPDNFQADLADDPLIGPAIALRVMERLAPPAAIDIEGSAYTRAAWERFLRRVDARTSNGHIPWRGTWPRDRAYPRVRLDGDFYHPVSLLRMHLRMPDEGDQWQRTCASFNCIAPDHHRVPAESPLGTAFGFEGFMAAWEASNPKFFANCRPKTWKYSDADPLVALCAWGHPLRVYGEAWQKRSAYCPECRRLESVWNRDYKSYASALRAGHAGPADYERLRQYLAQRLETDESDLRVRQQAIAATHTALSTLSPEPADDDPDMHDPNWLDPRPGEPEWTGPTLAEQVAAMNSPASHA